MPRHLRQCLGDTAGVVTESAWRCTFPVACPSADHSNKRKKGVRAPKATRHAEDQRCNFWPAFIARCVGIGYRNVSVRKNVHWRLPGVSGVNERSNSLAHVRSCWRSRVLFQSGPAFVVVTGTGNAGDSPAVVTLVFNRVVMNARLLGFLTHVLHPRTGIRQPRLDGTVSTPHDEVLPMPSGHQEHFSRAPLSHAE